MPPVSRLPLSLLLVATLAGCPPRTPPQTGPGTGSGGEGQAAGPLKIAVVDATTKVRPTDHPAGASGAALKAGRNELEAFQLVLAAANGEAVDKVSVALAKPLSGPGGATIPAANVVFYRVGYHEVTSPSDPARQTAGRWPDPLIPAVDTYVGERRNGFPLSVPAAESRAVWVEILVPKDATPGQYAGAVEVRVADEAVGQVEVALTVGRFALPSTASLRSAYGLEYAEPCTAHTGHESCAASWDEKAANTLRARYVRAGLEHRISIADVFWQPPADDSAKVYEALIAPYVDGTAAELRLPGARLTTIAVTPGDELKHLDTFARYLARRKLTDRAVFFAADEPSGDGWAAVKKAAARSRKAGKAVAVGVATSDMPDARQGGALGALDLLATAIDVLGATGEDAELPSYRGWQQKRPGRKLWAYVSCRSHGCGECGGGGGNPAAGSWPSRVIDASGVQNRALPWLLFSLGIDGERYAHVARRLKTAWQPGGQCHKSGAGDGTLFYPGKPAVIGGKTDIPVESIRLKLIREGIEDYEYLLLAAKKDPARAKAIAAELFPSASGCRQPAARLHAARDKLFALLDTAE